MFTTLLNQIQAIGLFTQIRASAYAYPALFWLHLVALFVWGGLVLMTDLRLLGLGFGLEPVTDLFNGFRRSKRISFLLAALCGLLMFGAKAAEYTYNPWFWVKMLLLALLGVNYLLLRRSLITAADPSSPNQLSRMKLTGAVSLLLVVGAVGAARGPATVKDLMHAVVDPNSTYLFDSIQYISDEQGIRDIVPETDEDWAQLRTRAQVLMDASDWLADPGRRAARPLDRAVTPEVENSPEEIQALIIAKPGDFALRARNLKEAVAESYRAIEAKDVGTLFDSLNDIDLACEGCHVRYWYPKDQRAVEAARELGILE